MSKLPTLKMKKRLNYVVITAFMLAFVIVIYNIVKITVFQYDYYSQKATQQQMRPSSIPANRGTIYDRNMQVVAQSATVWDVILSPVDIKGNLKTDAEIEQRRKDIAKQLSTILKIDEAKVLEQTHKKNQYEIIKKKVEKPEADAIRALVNDRKRRWYCITLQENTKRYYPNSTFASSVIGFTGSDAQGLYGLEQTYDKELKGIPGYIVTAKNGIGEDMPVSYEERFAPTNGNNLVLTIDETIQHFLEKSLTQVMKEHTPKKGAAGIVMNVNTGEILAMANMPNFDLNNPYYILDDTVRTEVEKLPEDQQKDAKTKAQQAQWNNKAISYAYQPGSVFKTVVASAALEEKTSSLHSAFNCPGYVKVGDRTMKCHKTTGHGSLDFTGAIVNSCNPSFVKIGSDLGSNLFYKYFKAFGLTEKTGIDLPGEGTSLYYTADKLGAVSLASCSFGQSMALTPIQVVTAVSAVVNGGKLVTPHVVKDVMDQNNNIVKTNDTIVKRQVISEETSKTMRGLMEEVVNAKGGTNASIKGYRIGGKSGTSQKQTPGDDQNAYISSYVAVAPMENPQLAVYIMVDEATSGQYYGSVISAPVAARVLSDTLPYLGYSPKFTEEEIANSEKVVPFVLEKGILEAQSALSAQGFTKAKVVGSGSNVVKQVPSSGSKMPRDGTVILYTEDVAETTAKVPKVTDLTPSAAKALLESKKFNVLIKGLATGHQNSSITAQSIAPGTDAPIGTVVEITCLNINTE
ncbi:penicillin-binding transpeptidase domain-containing protein [Paludicola sp. MB14-C6]|uniref:penicillin-binding transpeptidase domain-containing protein n=1 Tax=Paludihabitans sp. MB14-C6 TaxID=3070656 RepID=UPI0027DB6CCE|nr:penicillin-binding transpeptidase domain-containing protein [Paludicola sp. MB14-C6]WMJ23765.1 penicillin-binding transpeptidase domain-containing protein [Paludicola sp. MB14-C6]